MNEHDPQLEAALTATFAHRDREVGQVAGDLGDVRRRAARRKAKRRTLTAVGSVAIVAAGIGGLLAVGQIDRDGTARSAGGPATSVPSEAGSWFVCSEATLQEDGSSLYAWCELETGYANPAWRCSGEVPDPAMDVDDRPRFQSCTAVGEAYPTSTGWCVPVTAPPTIVPDPSIADWPSVPPVSAPVLSMPVPGGPTMTAPPAVDCGEACVPMSAPPTTSEIVGPSGAPESPPLGTIAYPCVRPSEYAPTLPPVPPTVSTVPAGTAPPVTNTCDGCPWMSPVEQIAVVAPGDSVAGIASTYGITIEQLVAYNQWPDGIEHVLVVDDMVKIPPNALLADDRCLHTIVAGDHPSGLAESYGTTVDELRSINDATMFETFMIGEVLLVPRPATGC